MTILLEIDSNQLLAILITSFGIVIALSKLGSFITARCADDRRAGRTATFRPSIALVSYVFSQGTFINIAMMFGVGVCMAILFIGLNGTQVQIGQWEISWMLEASSLILLGLGWFIIIAYLVVSSLIAGIASRQAVRRIVWEH